MLGLKIKVSHQSHRKRNGSPSNDRAAIVFVCTYLCTNTPTFFALAHHALQIQHKNRHSSRSIRFYCGSFLKMCTKKSEVEARMKPLVDNRLSLRFI